METNPGFAWLSAIREIIDGEEIKNESGEVVRWRFPGNYSPEKQAELNRFLDKCAREERGL